MDKDQAHTHTRTQRERSVSLTQLQRQSLICFVVKAVLFLTSVVMEMLHCHTTLEVSFWTEQESLSLALFFFFFTTNAFTSFCTIRASNAVILYIICNGQVIGV